MSERVDRFCEQLRERLNSVEAHLSQVEESVRQAPKETEAVLHAKVEQAKAKHEEHRQRMAAARGKLEERIRTRKDEVDAKIQQWKAQRDVKKLEHRADVTAEYAMAAMEVAAAAVAEADLATLEAIEAQRQADEVKSPAK